MKQLLIILFVFGITSCKNNNHQVDAYGSFEADEILVSSEIGGKIVLQNADDGDLINKSQLLAVIDTINLDLQRKQLVARQESVKANLEKILADVEVLKAQKENLQITSKRLHQMLKDGAASRQKIDDVDGQIDVINRQIISVQTQHVSSQKQLDVLDAQIGIVNDQLRRCLISSPVNATVLETYYEQGEIVQPGKSIYKIAALSTMTLRVYISGGQLKDVKLGSEVQVYIDKGKKEYDELKGTVSWIASKAEFTPKIIQTKEERVKMVYAVKIKVPNDGRLKIGMPGEIRIIR